MVQSAAFQLGKNLTFAERSAFTHNVAAPKLYKYSDAAYYSESEYTADDWKIRYYQKAYFINMYLVLILNKRINLIIYVILFFNSCRYWGEENYQSLLSIKMKWDPTMVFGCRHCIGDEEAPGVITKDTLPSWRFEQNQNWPTIELL